MSIQQKVKLLKLKTENGLWNYEDIQTIHIGLEFWVNCNSFQMRQARSRLNGQTFQTLMVQTEAETWLPAELLEYTNEFQVR